MDINIQEIIVPDTVQKKILNFYEELRKENEAQNLTSIVEFSDFFLKHILDSLAGYVVIRETIGNKIYSYSIADIGTGAGFPSIPIMLYDSQIFFTLIESNGKKVKFLQEMKKKFELNCRIINKNVKEVDEQFDIILFRALADLPFFFKIAKGVFKSSCFIFSYKGKKNIAKNELNLVKNRKIGLNIKESTIHRILGLKEERNIVEIIWEK